MNEKSVDKAVSETVSLYQSQWRLIKAKPEGKSGYLQKLINESGSKNPQATTQDEDPIQKLVDEFCPSHSKDAKSALQEYDQTKLLANALTGLIDALTFGDRVSKDSMKQGRFDVITMLRDKKSYSDQIRMVAEEPAPKYAAKKTTRKKA